MAGGLIIDFSKRSGYFGGLRLSGPRVVASTLMLYIISLKELPGKLYCGKFYPVKINVRFEKILKD